MPFSQKMIKKNCGKKVGNKKKKKKKKKKKNSKEKETIVAEGDFMLPQYCKP